MVRRKDIRARGKISLSRFFQKFEEGNRVAVVREVSIQSSLPKRIQGRTGTVKAKRGRSYVISLKDGKKYKKFIIDPVHLKKIK